MKTEDLQPGRELDALIAEKVMGWERLYKTGTGSRGETFFGPECTIDTKEYFGIKPENIEFVYVVGSDFSLEPPDYSTDISAAWEVVEHIGKNNFTVSTRTFWGQPKDSMALILKECGKDEWIAEYGESVPHAICLAALKVVGK